MSSTDPSTTRSPAIPNESDRERPASRAADVVRVDESLGRIRRSMARRALGRRVLTELAVTIDPAVMEVVEAIERAGSGESDVAVGTVAGLIGVDPSQASRLVASAVKAGLVERIRLAAVAEAIDHHVGGTYVCMEGPQFSSAAESHLHRSWNADVIGMTNMPEAKLAREAEISYATIAMVTDYDGWHPGHEAVSVEQVIAVLSDNRDKAQRLVARLALDFPAEHELCPIGSDRALDHAIMTAPHARDPELVAKLDAVAGRVL
jgi:hypothetical protein